MPARWIKTRELPLASLQQFPGNARRGNVEAIAESLAVNGQYRSIVVRDTGSEMIILAGNHTARGISLLASLSPGQLEQRYGAKIRAAIMEAEAAQAAAARAAETAADDEAKADALRDAEQAAAWAAASREALSALTSWSGKRTIRAEIVQCDDRTARRINLADNRLSDLAQDDPDDLAQLLSYLEGDYEGSGWTEEEVAKLIEPPEPAPDEGDEPDAQQQWGVIVNCRDEAHQRELLERFEAEGLDCRALM